MLRRTLAITLLLFAACASPARNAASGSASPTPSSTPTAVASPTPAGTQSGQLVGGPGALPGAIAGVHYRTATHSGITDASGSFSYEAGETITFSIADVDLRPAAGAARLSPWQLAADGACGPSADLSRLLVLLFSLDADGDPANGLSLSTPPPGSSQRALSTLDDAAVAALVDALFPGRAPADATAALGSFVTQMESEDWQQIGSDTFSGTDGLTRSQGAATDGASYFFSWTYGLQKDALDYSQQQSNLFAIPSVQSALGDNHIGDIDFWNGTLFVPLEDGSAYQHPFVAKYDPASLVATSVHEIPGTMMTAGVPWVAADGPRGVLYIAQWDPTPEILVFDMESVTFVRSIPLSTVVHRIQGAKVFEGALYLSMDDAEKTIAKVDLDTGTVIPLFAFHATFEEEGLVFLATADGAQMHTLNVNGAGMDFRHHQRTRAPLRQAVCAE